MLRIGERLICTERILDLEVGKVYYIQDLYNRFNNNYYILIKSIDSSYRDFFNFDEYNDNFINFGEYNRQLRIKKLERLSDV